MDYYVIAADGSKYGPTTLETLNKWAAQGRVTPTTIIERASDGVQGAASLLPGLVIPATATPSDPSSGPAGAGTPAHGPQTRASARTVRFKEVDAEPATEQPATAQVPQVGSGADPLQFKEANQATPAQADATPPTYGSATAAPAPGASQPAPVHDQNRQVQFKEVAMEPGKTPPSYGMTAVQGPGGYARGREYTYSTVPAELAGKFNWGAFVWTWIWGLFHRAYATLWVLGIGLLSIVAYVVVGGMMATGSSASAGTGAMVVLGINGLMGVVQLGLMIWCGARGYEWAWRSERFDTADECRKCQAVWGWWALGVLVLSCIGGVVLFAAGFAAAFGAARAVGH